MKTKRLEILENSLIKKNNLFNEKLENHIKTVKKANGQPLNDKRNGQATLNKWERQNDSLNNLKESIGRTERAIEMEMLKILEVEKTKEILPIEIINLIDTGILVQWRKHPKYFFVKGVEQARIVYDSEKKIVSYRYLERIQEKDQYKLFAKTYNKLNELLNK